MGQIGRLHETHQIGFSAAVADQPGDVPIPDHLRCRERQRHSGKAAAAQRQHHGYAQHRAGLVAAQNISDDIIHWTAALDFVESPLLKGHEAACYRMGTPVPARPHIGLLRSPEFLLAPRES